MIKRYILFLFVFANSVFCQDIIDTVHAISLQEFSVPSKLAYVAQNLVKFNLTAELFDINKTKIRDCKNIVQKPKSEDIEKEVRKLSSDGRAGIAIMAAVKEIIEEPGSYLIKFNVTGTGENRQTASKSFFYLVIVEYPTIAAPIKLRDKYYFSEKETFSFATMEYSDPNSYSYQVVDGAGTVLESGNGPVVNLEKVFNEANNVGKTIKIKGFYEGKPFTFKNPQKNANEKSEWSLTLDKPGLDSFSGWLKKEDDKDQEWLISIYNDASKSFLFTYIGSTPSGFVAIRPNPSGGVRVTSDPPEFLQGSGGVGIPAGSFLKVMLTVNDDFLNTIEIGGEIAVKLTVTFRTQFGENVKREFRATVIK
jgi:hypothetical protein